MSEATATPSMPVDVTCIQKMLPHRYPFLLVDRVVELEPHKRVRAIKNVSINEPFFQGHFPGHPVMPGVLVIEAMAQAGGLLSQLSSPENCPSRQKLFYLPYPYSDFIYAVIGEELGLLGSSAVVLAFVLLLWRGIRAAWKAPDAFGTYLAAGLTLSIVLQALINVSVVLGLLPTKGIPLPFISAGGTSLVLTLLSVGLVLNVSRHAD